MSTIPFGPEYKDPPWRWGSFLVGVVGFVALLALATLFDVWLLGWWSVVFIVLGYLFSARSGRAWARGRVPESSFGKTSHPTVAVEGKAGATYVLMESAKAGKGPTPKPREFGPFWWSIYSLFVRAPVAFGDFLLTVFWRFTSTFWSTSPGSPSERNIEHLDFPARMPPPDQEKF